MCFNRQWSGESLISDLVQSIYIFLVFFRFDAYPKSLFVSCHYILFVCVVAIVLKVNTANIQYFWVYLGIQIKYSWQSIISLLKYCTLYLLCTTVMTTILFSWLFLPRTWFIFQICWQLNMLIWFVTESVCSFYWHTYPAEGSKFMWIKNKL